MNLIINKSVPAMIPGFPTVSDKYNVGGGILTGSNAAKFGDLVKYTGTPGYYEKDAFTDISQVAGFILGTNVKLSEGFATNEVQVNPGEAFNLLINGFIAVQLDDDATTVTADAVAAVGALSGDTSVQAGKTYYTRASSAAGAGYLNDGTYAYTKVASPVGNPSTSSYYELSVLGSDATTDNVVPNAAAYVILATGKVTTADHASAGVVVQLPNCVFTGFKETRDGMKIAEVYVR